MKRLIVALLVLATCGTVFAGCLEQAGDRDDEGEEGEVSEARLLGPHPGPAPDGERMHGWLGTFVEQYPLRLTGSLTEQRAAEAIADDLRASGYTVTIQDLSGGDVGVPLVAGSNLRAIVATLPGTTMPERWIAWGGHYDSASGTIQGAYDNGSGTALALELARMMKDVETERTRAVILFNGEEQGRLASAAFVEQYQAQDAYVIDLFVGLDMVGIAYPAPGRPLAFYAGDGFADPFLPLARTIAWDLLDLPADDASVTFTGTNTRRSDEAEFGRIGIPTMRFAGLQSSDDYWGYHRANDTMETIHGMTQGPQNFRDGLANTAAFAYVMMVALDVDGMPEPL